MRTPSFFALASILALAACGSSSSAGHSAPAKACLDTADAIAKAAQRCGGDYKANYDTVIQQAANGNCDNVVAIRDETALRGTCFASLATISCTDLTAGNIDASCKSQLEHK